MPLTVPRGYERLGSVKLSGSAVTTGALTIPARDLLLIQVYVAGYSGGGDIASFRFNGDTGSNYWSRYVSYAAGGTTATNNQNVSQTLARIFAQSTTLKRSALVSLTNAAATAKTGVVLGQTSTDAAGTAGIAEFGAFEWVNTSAQITSVEMRTAGGSVTMPANTGFIVYGCNL